MSVFLSSDETWVIASVPLSSLFLLSPSVSLPSAGDVEGLKGLIDDPLENFFERLRQGVTDRCGEFFAGVGINQDIIFRSVFDPSLEKIFMLLDYRGILEMLLNEFTEEGEGKKGGKESKLGRFFEEVSGWISEQIKTFKEEVNVNDLFPLTRGTLAGQLKDGGGTI